MTKEEYYKLYKEKRIDTYVRYSNKEMSTAVKAFWDCLLGFLFSTLFLILFPPVFLYHVCRRYHIRRKTWLRYANGDESILEIIK